MKLCQKILKSSGKINCHSDRTLRECSSFDFRKVYEKFLPYSRLLEKRTAFGNNYWFKICGLFSRSIRDIRDDDDHNVDDNDDGCDNGDCNYLPSLFSGKKICTLAPQTHPFRILSEKFGLKYVTERDLSKAWNKV